MSPPPGSNWPIDFAKDLPELPETVVAYHKKSLKDVTKGRIELVIEKVFGGHDSLGLPAANTAQVSVFLAPRGLDYRYLLARLKYDSVKIYPVQIVECHGADTQITSSNHSAFDEQFRKIIGSDETKRVLASLYAQAN